VLRQDPGDERAGLPATSKATLEVKWIEAMAGGGEPRFVPGADVDGARRSACPWKTV
jgi:hypothetical protein